MGVTGIEHFDRVAGKLNSFFDGMESDLTAAGEAAAREIVQTTLAGIGDGDQPFAPYSPSYRAQLEASGAKPDEPVNLRGVFYGPGKRPPREPREKPAKAGKRYLGVGFIPNGPKAPPAVRPAGGLTDKQSEMSLDLIHVATEGTRTTIAYVPRENSYMIGHQLGTGRAPQRKWFSLNKAAVKARISEGVQYALRARVTWFNTPPT